MVSGKFDSYAYELQHAQVKVQVLEERLRQQRIAKYGPGSEKLSKPDERFRDVRIPEIDGNLLGAVAGYPEGKDVGGIAEGYAVIKTRLSSSRICCVVCVANT